MMWPRCCCGCSDSFTVSCSGTPVVDATVVVSNGTASVNGETSSSGQVTLSIQSLGGAGSYTLTATGGTPTCSPGYSGTLSLACGGSYTLECCAMISCMACDLGTTYPTLYVTDSYTTTACAWNGYYWYGCYQLPVDSLALTQCGCFNNLENPCGTPGPGYCTITYQISCGGDESNQLQVIRGWSWCQCGSTCSYCAWPSCEENSTPECYGLEGPFFCGPSDAQAQDTGTYTLANCDPFPFSLSLTLDTGVCAFSTPLPSPLEAGITVNS